MAKRIVVGLDGSEYADAAVAVALEAARRYGSTLVGVAVVDTPGIEASACGAGIGAYDYARKARELRQSKAELRAEHLLAAFKQRCGESKIDCELAYVHGVPFQAIVDEARCADLIIVGLRTYFREQTHEIAHPGDTLRRLMMVGVCPVLAVPCIEDPPDNALIAYDGSLQAARAMRSFVHLTQGNPSSKSVRLLHVGEGTQEDHYVQLDHVQRYLEAYGREVETIQRSGRPAEVIEAEAQARTPCVVVLGAYGRRGVKSLFFGSTADRLIRSECTTLFVYH